MSLPAVRRAEEVLRLPVMISAHEVCVRRWLAGARRFLGSQKLPHFQVGARVFLMRWEIDWAAMRGEPTHAPDEAAMARCCNVTIHWPGSTLSNPAKTESIN